MAELETKLDGVSEHNDTEQEVVPPVTETQDPESPQQDDGETAPAPAPTGGGQPADSGGASGGGMGYDQQIKALKNLASQYEPETDEQRKKRERREKSKKIIAAVTDGVRALSNLYFTSQYAPNMYNHEKGSQIAATTAHLDKMKAERDANNDRYLNYSLKIGNLENERAKSLRELEAQQQAQRLAREKAQREQEKHDWEKAYQPFVQEEHEGKAEKAKQDAIAAKAAADYAEDLQKAKIEEVKARTLNSRASAASHSRSNRLEFVAYDKTGKEHYFKTKEGAEDAARRFGTWVDEETENKTTGRDKRGNGTQTQKKKGGYSRMPVREDNTPPSRRNNNDNRPPSRR